MVKTCETCEFWEYIREGHGDCAIILDDTSGMTHPLAQITLDSLDGEDFARLLTHKSFGCNLHQEAK